MLSQRSQSHNDHTLYDSIHMEAQNRGSYRDRKYINSISLGLG